MEHLLPFCRTDSQRRVIELLCEGLSCQAVAKVLNITRQAVSTSRLRVERYAAEGGMAPSVGVTSGVMPGHRVKRVSQLRGDDGEIKQQWIISEPDQVALKDQLADILDALKEDIPRFDANEPPLVSVEAGDFLSAVVLGDPHLDMRAWAKACGGDQGQDWDIDIAYDQHIKAVTRLVDRAPDSGIGMLVILGDSLHRDSLDPFTKAGTLVDADGRLSRSLKLATRLFRAMIDKMLEKFPHVVVSFVRGNHSPTLELCLRDMLAIAYETTDRVSVLENDNKHIPYVFGDNFLLMTHGDKLNDQKKADIATSFYKRLHGNASFTHILAGHLHHSSVKEISGCLSEVFQALPHPDAWHYASGYVTSDQAVHLVTYHKSGGIHTRMIEYPRIFMN